jgi:Flp pilus assembly pilin Flp
MLVRWVTGVFSCLRDETGAVYIEYALVTSLLTVVGVGGLLGMAQALSATLANYDNNLTSYTLGPAP